jgi:deoxycytidylate deaminase
MREPREQLKIEVMCEIVKSISKLGTCKRAKVGALIVRDGRIISTGCNGSPPGFPHCEDVGCEMSNGHCIRTTHAEANAIAFAARHGIATAGAIMYIYGWVTGGDLGICPACNKLALSAGIVRTEIVPIEKEDEPATAQFDGIIHVTRGVHDCKAAGCK